MAHINIDVMDEQTFQSIEGQKTSRDAMCRKLSIYLGHQQSFT